MSAHICSATMERNELSAKLAGSIRERDRVYKALEDSGMEIQRLRDTRSALLAENERLRERLANLALEATHFLDNEIGRIHLRESIERANFALAGGRGEK